MKQHTLASGIELIDDEAKIPRGRAVIDAVDSEDLAIRLEILPW